MSCYLTTFSIIHISNLERKDCENFQLYSIGFKKSIHLINLFRLSSFAKMLFLKK